MSVAAAPERRPSLSPLDWRRAWLSLDENPRAVAVARTLPGALVCIAAFVVCAALAGRVASPLMSLSSVALIGATLAVVAVLPAWRTSVVVLSSLVLVAARPFRIEGWADLTAAKAATIPWLPTPHALQLAAVGAFLAFAFAMLLVFSRWNVKRPVVALFGAYGVAFAVANALPEGSTASAFAWTFAGVFISCIWCLAYALVDQKGRDATPTLARAGLMRPFWGGSATPIGKHWGYLGKFDAKDADALAVTRLKAVKLAVWALLLAVALGVMERFFFGTLGLPDLQSAILAHAANESAGVGVNWAALLANFALDLVIIAVWGHFIVAAVRLAGWRIPRNTRNPLASRTLAEFWNRYFFYFKELLVDFFFYPAFVRWFKKQPKLRIAFATFCAAGLGNFLYHFARETYVFAQKDLWAALYTFHNAVFYSLALATGLIVSQLRKRKPQPGDGFFAYEVRTRLGVIAFFCGLKIFDDITGEGSLIERADFALSLFLL